VKGSNHSRPGWIPQRWANWSRYPFLSWGAASQLEMMTDARLDLPVRWFGPGSNTENFLGHGEQLARANNDAS
jgi:hypothetical protein